ncbi:MAG: hypothetical protein ACO3JL_17435, partial [Myxococcota bacterium]
GATTIVASLVDYPAVKDELDVTVPPFPFCAPEILSPVAGSTLDIDADLATPGNQIAVQVAAQGRGAECIGAAVVLYVDGVENARSILPAEGGASGVATVLVTVPDGSSSLRASLEPLAGSGGSASVDVTFAPGAVGVRFVGIPLCAGFGDGCFNLSTTNDGQGAAYEKNLRVQASAPGGACPADPLLDVEGLASGLRVDGDQDGAVADGWTLNAQGFCEATFSLVTLHPDVSPDDILRKLTLRVPLAGEAVESREFLLGLDRVAPTLQWDLADGSALGIAVDVDPTTALLDARLGAQVTGMGGRSVAVSDGTATVVTSCTLPIDTDRCDFELSRADGPHTVTAAGFDRAGNGLVASPLTFIVDTQVPCVASIEVVADEDNDGVLAGPSQVTPVISDVVVTFEAAGCAIEDGQPVSLASSTAGPLAEGTTSGNRVTFTALTFPEGSYSLSIATSDRAANPVAPEGNALTMVVDVTGPSCAITSPAAGTLNRFVDSDPNTAGLQAAVQVNSDGTSVSLQLDGQSRGTNPTGTFPAQTLGEGTHTLNAICRDAFDNLSSAPEVTVFVDTIAPSLALVDLPAAVGSLVDELPGDGPGAVGVQTVVSVEVTGLEAGREVSFHEVDPVSGFMGPSLGSALAQGDTSAAGAPPERVQVPVSLLSCEGCSYVARAADLAGNEGESAPGTLSVRGNEFRCELIAPDPGAQPLVLNGSFDEDADNNAELSVSYRCDDAVAVGDLQAILLRNGEVYAEQSGAGPDFFFAGIELPNGPATLQLLVSDGIDGGGSDPLS